MSPRPDIFAAALQKLGLAVDMPQIRKADVDRPTFDAYTSRTSDIDRGRGTLPEVLGPLEVSEALEEDQLLALS